MLRRFTTLETVYPECAEFRSLAEEWSRDAIVQMLEWVWAGYEILRSDILFRVDWSRAKDDLERELTELLDARIRMGMPALTFCYLQHEKKERESRLPAPAQPPEYDLAFVL